MLLDRLAGATVIVTPKQEGLTLFDNVTRVQRLMEAYVEKMRSEVIGASVSELPLVDSTDALSCTMSRYIRPAPATAHARRYAQT